MVRARHFLLATALVAFVPGVSFGYAPTVHPEQQTPSITSAKDGLIIEARRRTRNRSNVSIDQDNDADVDVDQRGRRR